MGFAASLFTFYSVAPAFLVCTSATFFNLSLLTANFYAAGLGVALLHEYPPWLYVLALAGVLSGLVLYYVSV